MQTSPSKKELREFGLLLAIAFPLFIGWILPAIAGHGFREWTLWIGLSAMLLGLFTPRTLHYPFKIWIAIGNVLGFINSHIILGIVFLLVLQPIALVMRLYGYDPLKKKKSFTSTYREIRKNPKIDLNRIF